jgi:methionyl-tRNA formyltransferase
VKVAFFGLPIAALLLARDGHEIAYAAVCRRSAIGTRRLRRAIGDARVEVKPDAESDATLARVREAHPDLVVSWFWTTKLPARVLEAAPLGAVGVHPSLLPRHRGPDPYFWAIDSGDAVTGVTAHVLDATYDTGAILATRTLAIDPKWNAWTLAKKLDRPSLALLREVVRAYSVGASPARRAQDEREATAAPQPGEEMLAIRWTWDADRIVRRVRAAAPWPGAWTEIASEVVTIVAARASSDYPRALVPGEATVRADGIAVVRAGDDAVELLAGRDDDDHALGPADLAARVERARAES